jgi:hypothetical protein
MALKKFIFGFNSAEFQRLHILFMNGEKAGLVPSESVDSLYQSMEKLSIFRLFSLGICGTFTYVLPVPLDFVYMVGAKIMIFSLGHRSLTFLPKMEYLNKLHRICEEFELDKKTDLMEIPENDRIFLKGFENISKNQNK